MFIIIIMFIILLSSDPELQVPELQQSDEVFHKPSQLTVN